MRWLLGPLALLALALPTAVAAAGEAAGGGPATAILLTVRDTAGVARHGEVVRSGVPLARELGVRSTAALAVLGPDGEPVPAELRVLARWHAVLDDETAPIQWLLVVFPATVPAGGSATYQLVGGGRVKNPAPPRPLALTRDGDAFTVDTGEAVFRFGRDPGALFDQIALPDGTVLAAGGELSVERGEAHHRHPRQRGVTVEHQGPLSAVVVVRGEYDMPAVGSGGLSSVRRYVFTAGSPTAVVRHAVAWEGDLNRRGTRDLPGGGVNGLVLERVRDTLEPKVPTVQVLVAGARGAPPLSGRLAEGEEAFVHQRRRDRRTDPLRFEAAAGGERATGVEADGALLAAGDGRRGLVVALRSMHRYEPQALRRLAGGTLALDLAAQGTWLATRQGLFATFAVAAWNGEPDVATLEQRVWAPLNRPLRAWPGARVFADSRTVDGPVAGELPKPLRGYDRLLPKVLRTTLERIDRDGIAGLMTFGVYPRYWGLPYGPAEADCGRRPGPTPEMSWDDPFWCATWTDYHHTASSAVLWAMRSGEVEWLDELAFPAALRVLHTQIYQCRPDDGWFYCGQAPNGYGGYRSDFNSSHAYFDNLFLYYWLTGDSVVIDTLLPAARRYRDHCRSRGCGIGRPSSQWVHTFRFAGLAGGDAGLLEAYSSQMGEAAARHWVEARRGEKTYGLLVRRPVEEPGRYLTEKTWIASFYFMNNLHRFLVDSGDQPLGDPPLAPSRMLVAWARTLADLASTVHPGAPLYRRRFPPGDGTAEGTWANILDFTWSGERIGGHLDAVTANLDGEHVLWPSLKGNLVAALARGAWLSGDPELERAARELTGYVIAAALRADEPLGKNMGLYLTRLHAAVALLADLERGGAPPPPGPSRSPGASPRPDALE